MKFILKSKNEDQELNINKLLDGPKVTLVLKD